MKLSLLINEMDRDEFKDLTGEDPIDMFGPDWENEVQKLGLTAQDVKMNKEEQECPDCGGTGEVTTMEPVYPEDPGSPLAPIGTAKCHCRIKEPEYDNQE